MSGLAARLVAIACALFAACACAATDVAIVGGLIHTLGPAGVIERGTVLIRDDRIVAVGADVPVPANAQVIDAAGAWVTPGIFNAWTQLGLVENEDVRSTMDHEAAEATLAAGFDIEHGFNPYSTLIPITRLRGVTRSVIAPNATHSMFGGLGALIRLDSSEQALFKSRALAFVELGARGARLAGGARGAMYSALYSALDAAQAGQSSAKKAAQEASRDENELALRLVVAGEIPLVTHVERAADILNVLDLPRRYPRLRIILMGANEAWMVADRIAAARVPVIVDSFANLPLDFEMMAATQENAARLSEAGVLIAIAPLYRFHAATPHNAGLVTQYAGNAVANGLPWEKALEAVTLNPARMFGVSDQLGSIEPGKIADIVVWSGDPLQLSSRPDAVFIAGRAVPMQSRQTKLRDRYRDLSGPMPHAYRR